MISVVMPVYNHVAFVREAIDSVLNQTYKNFELILVDDGSTDGSSNILKEYANRDGKIKYMHKENGGTGSALNLGFSCATGKYGTWVSSDNIYYPELLQKLRTFLEKHSVCRFVFSSFFLGSTAYRYFPHPKHKVITTGIMGDFLDRSLERCITGICYLFEMSLKHECGKYVLVPGEDYVMGVKMGLRTKVGYISEVLGLWRDHPNTVTEQIKRNERSPWCPVTNKTANQMAQLLIREAKQK